MNVIAIALWSFSIVGALIFLSQLGKVGLGEWRRNPNINPDLTVGQMREMEADNV